MQRGGVRLQENDVLEKLLQRSEKFRWDVKKLKNNLAQAPDVQLNFEILHDHIMKASESSIFQKLNDDEKIEWFFNMIFHSMNRTEEERQLCFEIAPEMFQIGKFMTLCTFLNTSKRIKGESIKDFVFHANPLDFPNPDSANYRAVSLWEAETEKFKKSRMRLLSQGRVYIKNTQWNAISKDAAYEWGFYYALEKESSAVHRAFKKQKNLYSDIRKIRSFEKNENFKDEVRGAYKKFISRLKKLNYEDYLQLQKIILVRICGDKEYYGINLYRLERRLRPYLISHEVKWLEACTSYEEKRAVLAKTVCLDDICFPGLYEKLFKLPMRFASLLAQICSEYLARISMESCLILDELVERNSFGDDWENRFRGISNALAESVLYDPATIDVSATKKSQQEFLRLLNAGVVEELKAYFN